MNKRNIISRRSALKGIGGLGAFSLLGFNTGQTFDGITNKSDENIKMSSVRKEIYEKVWQTPFIDTHEHLIEESERLAGTKHRFVKSDDWTMLFSHYLNSDLLTAGMPPDLHDKFFSPEIDPHDKWTLIEPYWPAIKNTGYGQAVCIAINELYNVDEISVKTIKRVQSGYEKLRKPGFYKEILIKRAKIDSCQVNCLDRPFGKSEMPTLLMQDLSIVGMFQGPNFKDFGESTGISINSLSDWHDVIDWWFMKYGKFAVAVKSQNAYRRDIDYVQEAADKVESIFNKILNEQALSKEQKKAIEDHLFWYAVNKATEFDLPIKLHTGYYAGQNRMPLARLINNPGSAADLCRLAPDAKFVFMHICYPYYEEIIAIAKHYTNAYVDMCWSWIINPVAAKDFLKKYIVTAPANKILTFGGDYIPVEPILGHAIIARRGIALALSELVEDGWLSLNNALDLTDPIMHGNARRIFNLVDKEKRLRDVSWGKFK